MFNRGLNLGQVPGLSRQVVDGGIILQESNSLDVQGYPVSRRQDDTRMDGQPPRGSPANKGNPPIHDDLIRLNGDAHFHGPLGNKHIVISMEEGSVE